MHHTIFSPSLPVSDVVSITSMKRIPFLESVNGFALPPVASIPPGLRAADPKWCSTATLFWAQQFNAKWTTAHRVNTKGWPLRSLLVLKKHGDFVLCMCFFQYLCVRHMMDCIAVALPLSTRLVQRQLVIYTFLGVVFLELYDHRHLSLPWCV